MQCRRRNPYGSNSFDAPRSARSIAIPRSMPVSPIQTVSDGPTPTDPSSLFNPTSFRVTPRQLPPSASSPETKFFADLPGECEDHHDRTQSVTPSDLAPQSKASTAKFTDSEHLRSSSSSIFHQHSPTHSRKGSYAALRPPGISRLGVLAPGYYAPRGRAASLALEESPAPSDTSSTSGHIIASSHYIPYWSQHNAVTGTPMILSMASTASDSRQHSTRGAQHLSPGYLSSCAVSRQQSSSSMRVTGTNAAAFGSQRRSFASEQSSPYSSSFPHIGEGIRGAPSPTLSGENVIRPAENGASVIASPYLLSNSSMMNGSFSESEPCIIPPSRTSSQSLSLHAPIIPRRNSSQRVSLLSWRSSSGGGTYDSLPEKTMSPPLQIQKVQISEESRENVDLSDTSDYGSQPDGDDDERERRRAVETDGPEGDSTFASELTTVPPKLKRPNRTHASLAIANLTLSPKSSEAQDVSHAGSSPQASPQLSVDSVGAESVSHSLNPRKPRLEPSLERQQSILLLRSSMHSESAEATVVSQKQSEPASDGMHRLGGAIADAFAADRLEAELEAAALRQADEEDPNRPRTLKEARELAKLRAKVRRGMSESTGSILHASRSSAESNATDEGNPKGQTLRVSTSSSQHSKRSGQLSPSIAKWPESNQEMERVPSRQSSTMEELQAAVGDAIDGLDFGESSEGADDSIGTLGADLSSNGAVGESGEASISRSALLQSTMRVTEPVHAAVIKQSSGDESFDSRVEAQPLQDYQSGHEQSSLVRPSDISADYSEDAYETTSSYNQSAKVSDAGKSKPQSLKILPGAADQKYVPRSLRDLNREPTSATGPGVMSLTQALAISGPTTPATPTQHLPAVEFQTLPAQFLLWNLRSSTKAPSTIEHGKEAASIQIVGVPGKTVPFPAAYDTRSIAVDKKRLPPWERARAYAVATNELAAAPRALSLWMDAARRGSTTTATGKRNIVGRGHPSSLAATASQVLTGDSSAGYQHPRDVSEDTVKSDQTFPTRGDGGKARDITQAPIDVTAPDSMPGALPANIPYPQLVHQPVRSLSSTSGVGSLEANSPGPSASANSSGQTNRVGLRNRNLSINALDSKSPMNTAGIASTRERRSGTFSRARDGVAGFSPNSLSTSSSQTSQRSSLFSSLGRRGSKRAANFGPPQALTASGSLGAGLTGSVSGPRAPRLPGAAGALGRAIGYGYGHSSAQGSSGSLSARTSPGPSSATVVELGAIAKNSVNVNMGLVLSSKNEVDHGEPNRKGSPLATSGPRILRDGGRPSHLKSSPSIQAFNSIAGERSPAGSYIPTYPIGSSPPPKKSPGIAARLGVTQLLTDPAAGGVSCNGNNDRLLSSLRGGGRKNSSNSVTSGSSADRLEERPEFKESLRKLADVLPDADEDVLVRYLRRASGNDLRAIGDYLGDQATGHLKALNSRT